MNELMSPYDHFILEDNRDIIRPSTTRYYSLAPKDFDIRVDSPVPLHLHGVNYVFLSKRGADLGYLLHHRNPVIDTSLLPLQSEHELRDCFDIVFIANGESVADKNYERLLALGLPNQIFRIDNVPGRNNAYKTAARTSTTRYFYAVFAKLEINPEFDFTFGTHSFDHRHYVFEAQNPLNGLCYGHQAMILYNKAQVLDNPGDQIDFTMAQFYRAIPELSGVARFNYSAVATYRTTFREITKLVLAGDPDSMSRVNTWIQSDGPFADVVQEAVMDAMQWVETKPGMDALVKGSYDWDAVDKRFGARL